MEVTIHSDAQSASNLAARVVARLVHDKPDAVLGLAPGSAPQLLYKELIRLHRIGGLDFSRIIAFNLDEYAGLGPDHPASFHHFMWKNLFAHINIKPVNVHFPDGLSEDIPASCAAYEQAILDAGGIDLQVLGIGTDGHIGLNEPTSSFASRTRIKTLTHQTVAENAIYFEGNESKVPMHAITMGIGTIMDARAILMLAVGVHKTKAVAAAVEGPVSAMVPASILQHHPRAKIFMDEQAAAGLKLSEYYHWIYNQKPDWQKDI